VLAGLTFSPALIGGLVAAAGALLPWVKGGAASENAFGVPVQFLVDQETTADGGFSLGWLVLAAAITGCVILVRGGEERIRKAAGSAAAGVAVLYVVQVQRLVSSFGGDAGVGVTDIVGFGVLVTLAGGLVLAFAPGRRR
jgi:hypothetical protein